jgi:hypothetical protein
MKYTREQAEEARQIVVDFMQYKDYCFMTKQWDDFLNAKFPTIDVGKWVIGDEYEFSDDEHNWQKRKLLAVLPNNYDHRFIVELLHVEDYWQAFNHIRPIESNRIEVGKWYKSEKEPDFLGLVKEIDGDRFYYNGFNVGRYWKINDWYGVGEPLCITPATDQEVLERLTEEAKMLYKKGDDVISKSSSGKYKLYYDAKPFIEDGFFWYKNTAVLDLSTGEWAEVVEQNNDVHEQIEKLEKELKQLKSML